MAIEIFLILSKSPFLDFLVMSTQTHRQMVDFSWKKTRKNIYSKKKLLCPKMSHAAILVSLLFSKWTKTKQKQKNFVNKTQKVL